MLQAVSPRRLFCIGLLACTVVLLTSDSASAQRWRRGGVGVGYGGWYGGPGYGVYGSPMYGYRSGFGNPAYSYSYPSYSYGSYASPIVSAGYTGTTAYSYPQTAGYSYQAGFSGYASNACCDPCATGVGPYGTTSTSGYLPANAEQGLQIVEVHQGPAQTAGIMRGAVIEKVGETRVRTFNDLQTALQTSNGQAMKVTIIDPNGQRHVRDVAVKDNKMGVSVVETSVFLPQDGSQPRPSDTIPQPLPDRTTPDARDPNATPATPRPDATPDRSTPPRTTTPAPDRTTPAPDRSNPNRPKVND